MSSTNEDSDDLDARPRKHKAPASRQARNKSSSSFSFGSADELEPYGDSERPRKKVKRIPEGATRLEWTDSDGENAGAAAYKKFKARASNHRKQAIASTKRAKARDLENNPRPNKKDEGQTGVGRQAPKRQKKRGKPEATYGDVPSDEEGMDHTLPDYVQDRRNRFDERAEKLKEAGLALPPTYEDVYFSDNERIKNLKERPDLPHIKPPVPYEDIELPYSLGIIPAPIAQYLREYQVKGAAFLHELFVYQKGGILGDDMGLGKTIQVIAFLTAAYGKTGDERDKKRMRKMRNAGLWYPKTLVVCPGSLMANWQDEFKRWGWWHTDLFHGSAQIRDDVLAQAKSGNLEVMITTYNTYRLYNEQINMLAWDCVITDECHTVKGRKSEITKTMNQVNSLCRIGLTGTAVQNNLEELWTLLNWSNPGRFGPISTWKYTISEPLKLGQSHNATTYELARARKTAKQLVDNLLPQFFLRRMKSLIKDQLPKKTDRVVFCPLTPAQADAYRNFLESDYVETIKNSSQMCDCESGKKQGWCCRMTLDNGDRWQEWVFPCIAYLQRLSNHLALLIPSSHDEKRRQAKDTEMLSVAVPDQWQELVASRDSILNYSNPSFCGKWRVLRKLLKFWHDQGSNKVLVFSHSVRLLKMLQALFLHTNYNLKYLDGSMTYEDRYVAVGDFNTDPTQFVFLISTRAGGVGLNITSANKVVVVDPNWNPSYDLQAQDRAYRIGQTRDVEVFRLVSQGTLEEIVYARQIYKQQISNVGLAASDERRYFTGVQDRPSQKGEIFGLQNLFAYQDENVVLRDIVHKTNVAEARADLQIAELDLENEETHGSGSEHGHDTDGPTTKSNSQPRDRGKEDEAMSQLAKEIIGDPVGKGARGGRGGHGGWEDSRTKPSNSVTGFGGGTGRHDPIQAILASAGVSYTHENSEVVGSSRVEAALSKRAAEASLRAVEAGASQLESRVFVPASQSQRNGQEEEGEEIRYRYRPPEDVMRRQLCSMARWAGYEGTEAGVVEFALVVESWTQAERREFLERWYRFRRDVLVNGIGGKKVWGGEGDEGLKGDREDVMREVDDGVKKEEEEDGKVKIEHGTTNGMAAGGGSGDVAMIDESDEDDEL